MKDNPDHHHNDLRTAGSAGWVRGFHCGHRCNDSWGWEHDWSPAVTLIACKITRDLMQLFKEIGCTNLVERVARFNYDPFGRLNVKTNEVKANANAFYQDMVPFARKGSGDPPRRINANTWICEDPREIAPGGLAR